MVVKIWRQPDVRAMLRAGSSRVKPPHGQKTRPSKEQVRPRRGHAGLTPGSPMALQCANSGLGSRSPLFRDCLRLTSSFGLAQQIFGTRNSVSGSVTAEKRRQAAFETAGASFLIGHFTQAAKPIALNTQAVAAVEGGGQRPL